LDGWRTDGFRGLPAAISVARIKLAKGAGECKSANTIPQRGFQRHRRWA
jgi:hypothetical protein